MSDSPPGPASQDLTESLRAWTEGDADALSSLFPRVYSELKRLARGHLRGERQGHTLQTTVVVHESFLRLVDQQRMRWQDRAHFYSFASVMMRRLLVDHARRRDSAKRGGPDKPVPLDDLSLPMRSVPAQVLALDEALKSLARIDERKVKLVQLRYFGGFSVSETAEILGCSRTTVVRQWRAAKAWLLREMNAALSGRGDAADDDDARSAERGPA